MDKPTTSKEEVNENAAFAAKNPPTEKWGWWVGSDEETYDFGPFATESEAVTKGQAVCGGLPFYVLYATKGTYDILLYASDYIDSVDNANYELSNPNDSGVLYDIGATGEQINELIDKLNTEIMFWVERNKFNLTTYCFDKQFRPKKFVPMTGD